MKKTLVLCMMLVLQLTLIKAASIAPQQKERISINLIKHYFDWGYYTGYLLGNDGCYHHGTFYWSGSPQNYFFVPDNNPDSDEYFGNENICFTDAEWEYLC